jgi:hypothetical protein
MTWIDWPSDPPEAGIYVCTRYLCDDLALCVWTGEKWANNQGVVEPVTGFYGPVPLP